PKPVDDAIGCTLDSCNENAHTVVHYPDGAACDDGLYCNGVESCDALTGCKNGVLPDINDNVSCTIDTCDETTDKITHLADNSKCLDGLWCNGIEKCDFTDNCITESKPDCNDNIDCTAETCNEGEDNNDNRGNCLFTTTSCGCTGNADCNDNNPCTDDICTAQLTCQNKNNDTNSCDDGFWCTVNNRCSLGKCTSDPKSTNDNNDCTEDSCDEITDKILNKNICVTDKNIDNEKTSSDKGSSNDYSQFKTEDDAAVCIENWVCEFWSDCIEKMQTRKCNDVNNCGTTIMFPVTLRECSVATEENVNSVDNTISNTKSKTGIATNENSILKIIIDDKKISQSKIGVVYNNLKNNKKNNVMFKININDISGKVVNEEIFGPVSIKENSIYTNEFNLPLYMLKENSMYKIDAQIIDKGKPLANYEIELNMNKPPVNVFITRSILIFIIISAIIFTTSLILIKVIKKKVNER
ncbi:MAG: hypothetical protein V1859_03100, partial [archaeon]